MFYHQVFSNKLGTDFRWLDLPVQWLITVRAERTLRGALILTNKLPFLKSLLCEIMASILSLLFTL